MTEGLRWCNGPGCRWLSAQASLSTRTTGLRPIAQEASSGPGGKCRNQLAKSLMLFTIWRMEWFRGSREHCPALPVAVLVAHLALAAWIPVAHSFYHRWEELVPSPAQPGGGDADVPVLASTCPVCSSALGASATESLPLSFQVFSLPDPAFDPAPSGPHVTLHITAHLPRGPPLA